jgi:hypothetical protein
MEAQHDPLPAYLPACFPHLPACLPATLIPLESKQAGRQVACLCACPLSGRGMDDLKSPAYRRGRVAIIKDRVR